MRFTPAQGHLGASHRTKIYLNSGSNLKKEALLSAVAFASPKHLHPFLQQFLTHLRRTQIRLPREKAQISRYIGSARSPGQVKDGCAGQGLREIKICMTSKKHFNKQTGPTWRPRRSHPNPRVGLRKQQSKEVLTLLKTGIIFSRSKGKGAEEPGEE